ncbi:hypothetical protein DESUT3_20310 [Desulfuromonas versatilis]|uniref:Tetratricopeptide repeat protein n=1 Tax=Desulfuromonas versatilis TaxID=2802975 RepID=A0ABN6DY64_9BACT|nr:tetratricopeptide repeat protein [Desulfuromonas versatilis]BCR04962.1 hypothetical protein DESUT3_20310 [Desulfuromonas versatilis]
MSAKLNLMHCVKSKDFLLWTPPAGRVVEVGPQRLKVPLPEIPLPIHRKDIDSEEPSDNVIGEGLYDFLRQFPDDSHATRYAKLLQEAYPHFLADLGAQIVMLEHKEVDAAYVQRKINFLKILALLEPGNPGLMEKLGLSCFELGMMFAELPRTRTHLLKAMGYLQRSLNVQPENPTCLNVLGQIDYLMGDYPTAARRWGGVVDLLEEPTVRGALGEKIARINREEVPDHPLLDDLEAIGAAMEHFGRGEIHEATTILEILEENNILDSEFPLPEVFHLLGMCRARNGDPGGAFEAFEKALELDPGFAPALAGREAILEGRMP